MQLGTKIDKLVIHDHNEKDLGLKSLIKQTGDAQDRPCNHLRNEFHFSGVHGAMNRSGSRAK